jgi:hypothetical protein
MFSLTKKIDKELLLEIAEMIEVLYRLNRPEAKELAEKFGEDYLRLEEKIKTYDYSKEDFYDSNHSCLYHNQTL